MNQLTLFDRPANICRKSDPITSHQSAAETELKLNITQSRMLGVMTCVVPKTANEAARICNDRFGGGLCETYRKRCRELVERGLLIECGERACEVTGKAAMTFKAKEKT
jgi:hypothetical protein